MPSVEMVRPGLFRHRGRDDRLAAGPCVRPPRSVRPLPLLPRARRPVPRRGRLGSGTLGIEAGGEGRVVECTWKEREIEGAACASRSPGTWASSRGGGLPRGPAPLCDASGAPPAFDEVISPASASRAGAQERYGALPDLTVLGKSLAADCRLGAGEPEPTERLAPAGDVYQAGTLSGLLPTAAGLSGVLRRLTPDVYGQLAGKGQRLDVLLHGRFECVGAMATLFVDYPALFRHLLERGIYLAPSQNEAMSHRPRRRGDRPHDRSGRARPRRSALGRGFRGGCSGTPSRLRGRAWSSNGPAQRGRHGDQL